MPRASIGAIAAVAALGAARAQAANLQVVSTSPVRNVAAAPTAAVSITFDRAVQTSSITASSLRVFGRVSGTANGPFTFSNGDTTVTLTPTHSFIAGEVVLVNLSHDVVAADTSPLRSAGFAYQFRIQTQPAGLLFNQIDVMSDRTDPGTGDAHLRRDGGRPQPRRLCGPDHGQRDQRRPARVHEQGGRQRPVPSVPHPAAADRRRIEPERAGRLQQRRLRGRRHFATDDQSGGSRWGTARAPLARHRRVPVAPSRTASSRSTWTAMPISISPPRTTARQPVAPDQQRQGVFGASAFRQRRRRRVRPGPGRHEQRRHHRPGRRDARGQPITCCSATATARSPPDAAERRRAAWKLAVGDVNGDGKLDVTIGNSDSNTGAILLGNGDGTLAAPQVVSAPATWSGRAPRRPRWRRRSRLGAVQLQRRQVALYTNDGTGTFAFDQDFTAVSNPSCAIILDLDNDRDLDLALTDEIADKVVLLRNGALSPCPPAPQTCRTPTVSGKALLKIKDGTPDQKDKILWKWSKGAATTPLEFGNPLATDAYTLCLYDNNALVTSATAPAGATCPTCWVNDGDGFTHNNPLRTPEGVQKLTLKSGGSGDARILFKGRGLNLRMPDLALTGPVDVQLVRRRAAYAGAQPTARRSSRTTGCSSKTRRTDVIPGGRRSRRRPPFDRPRANGNSAVRAGGLSKPERRPPTDTEVDCG